MREYCYVIINNAGHSWPMVNSNEAATAAAEPSPPALPHLLHEGWVPVRETPMGGGTSALAHSLILLERTAPEKAPARKKRKS